MRLLLLLDRVPAPDEVARCPVDTDWVRDVAGAHDVLLAVDEDGPGTETLRDEGVTVHVSERRLLYLPDGTTANADEMLARWVLARHDEAPVDVVVAASHHAMGGPVHDRLVGVPWVVLAGAGPEGHARRLGTDEEHLRRHPLELWASASTVVAAEAVCSHVHPSALGLAVGAVPCGTLWAPPTPHLATEVEGALVVVAATGVGAVDGPGLVPAVLDVAPPSATVVVVVGDDGIGSTPAREAVAAGVPAAATDRVVIVPSHRTARPGAWLDVADALVLADAGELLVPSVARAAARLPTVVLGSPPSAPPAPLEVPRHPTEGPRTDLLGWTGPLVVATELRRLAALDGPELVVLHADEDADRAATWAASGLPTGIDVVVPAPRRRPWGGPDLRRPDGSMVAVHRRALLAVAGAVEELAAEADGVPDVVGRLLDVEGARSHTVAAHAVDERTSSPRPATTTGPLPLDHGPLPLLRAPRPAPTTPGNTPATPRSSPSRGATGSAAVAAPEAVRSWAHATPWSVRARLALPWRLGLAATLERPEVPAPVARWARRTPVATRIRLVAPTRYGLLARAMEGRW